MSDVGYNEIADLALRKTGQVFGPHHRYLVEARLAPILRRESFSSLGELADCLQARPNPVLDREVAAALTGKETAFFRGRKTLNAIVLFLITRAAQHSGRPEPVRLLCAGGGTGQEAYSLAIALHEQAPEVFDAQTIELVSVDVCKASILRARAGEYGHYEIQTGLSAQRMLRYFTRVDSVWRASDVLRKRVDFQVQNLIEDIGELGHFDAILCRNVLPAMAKPFAISVAEKLISQLQPWGQFVLGEEETPPGRIETLAPSMDVRGAFCRNADSDARSGVA